jgi:hypothetical protein
MLTTKQPDQHIIGSLIPLKQVFVHHSLPPFLVHLFSEEGQIVMIVLLLPKIGLKSLRVMHILDDGSFERPGRALIGYIVRVSFLDLGGRGAECKDSEEVMRDVVLKMH